MKNEISEIGYFFVLQKRSLECFDSQQVNNFWPTLDNYCVDIKFDMIFLFSYFLIIVMHMILYLKSSDTLSGNNLKTLN